MKRTGDLSTTKSPRIIDRQVLLFQLIKYGLVGLLCALVDFVLLNLTKSLLFPLWLALAVGFAAGTILGYRLHSRWTFGYNTIGQGRAKFSQFVILALTSLLLTELIVHLFVFFFNSNLHYAGMTITSYNVGKLISLFVIYLWNFFISRFVIFRPTSGQEI